MRDEIRQRFTDNIARAQNLVAVYRRVTGVGQGRRPVNSTDILRAATVFAHAALEEVFRGIATWKYPTANEAVLNEVPLVGSEHGRPEKFFLGKLAAHRQKSIQALIDESVRAHINNFTINNTTDIATFLRRIGIDPIAVNQEFELLIQLISRRHHIVHQADRNDVPGQGHHRARALSANDVGGLAGCRRSFRDPATSVDPGLRAVSQ